MRWMCLLRANGNRWADRVANSKKSRCPKLIM